jgi:predicted nucleic acid-binding protein
MALALLDTNVYIGHWELGLYQETLERVRRMYIVRHSAVVLSELRRGSRTRAAQKMVGDLYRVAAIRWTPSGKDWWEAGQLVRVIADKKGWDRNKRRDFQNDTLIALTARKYGATLVTSNLKDFLLLANRFPLTLLEAT